MELRMALFMSLAIRVCTVLLGIIGGALLIGQSQPMPPSIAQLHLTACLPPCWVGIVPGVTTVADAKAKIVAAFIDGSDLTIRDSSSTDRSRPFTSVENTIEGNDFYLIVRLNISELIDGNREIVQSIDLFQSSQEGQVDTGNAPTVAEILGAFGAPEGVVVEAFTTIGFEISLKYSGMDATFYTAAKRVALSENTHLYFETPGKQRLYRPWAGFRTLDLES
jgi:hypothetical protein